MTDDEQTVASRLVKGRKREPWILDSSDWPLIINEGDMVVVTFRLPEGSVGDDEAGLFALATARRVVTAVNEHNHRQDGE